MSNCYLCGVELNGKNESEEHIFLNALGGRYKSKKLLCKNCNNSIGSDCDAALANQYHFLTNMLELDLERGKPRAVTMKADDGLEYKIKSGKTPELSHPIVETEKTDSGNKISIIARNKDELKKILENLKEKKFEIDIEKSLDNAVCKKEQIPQLRKRLTFGGIESFPAILKMAVSQYIDKFDDIENVKSAIEDIKNPIKDLKTFKKVELCILENEIFNVEDDEVLHSIFLCANKKKHKLYAIIQLFSTQQYIVKLSDSYDGRDFADLTVYDVMKKKMIDKKNLWTPDFDFIFTYEYPKSSPKFEIMQNRFSRVMQIAMKKRSQN
ncbi:MAG: HNH endonuclease [Treponemataceae bacterium]|nr:HNH endonuclease [Treponemataceae bacterium]